MHRFPWALTSKFAPGGGRFEAWPDGRYEDLRAVERAPPGHASVFCVPSNLSEAAGRKVRSAERGDRSGVGVGVLAVMSGTEAQAASGKETGVGGRRRRLRPLLRKRMLGLNGQRDAMNARGVKIGHDGGENTSSVAGELAHVASANRRLRICRPAIKGQHILPLQL